MRRNDRPINLEIFKNNAVHHIIQAGGSPVFKPTNQEVGIISQAEILPEVTKVNTSNITKYK